MSVAKFGGRVSRRFAVVWVTLAFVAVSYGSDACGAEPVLDPTGSCDYVIVAPTALAASFQPLADWKTSRGVRTRVVTLDWVLATWRGGTAATALRNFLRDAYRTWGISWVLLGGDVTDGAGAPLLPSRMVVAKVIEQESMPSDLYFACLDGSWDGDGDGIYGEVTDGVELDPEVFVGRAPVRTPEEVDVFVDKVLRYEQAPPSGLAERVLWIAADSDERTIGKDMVKVQIRDARIPERIQNVILSTADQNLDASSMTEQLNTYAPHVLYVEAHGNADSVALDGTSFTNAEADGLTNDFPFVFLSTACLTNRFDDDSLTEHLMRNRGGGAVACWSCSRFGWYTPGNAGYGASEVMARDFWNLLYRDYPTEPPAMGELIHRARRQFMQRSTVDGTWRWLTFGLNLLGCPELPLWTATPSSVEVTVDEADDFERDGCVVTVSAGGAPAVGAHVVLWRQTADKPTRVTVWGKGLVPRTVEVTAPVDAEGGRFARAVTDGAGRAVVVPAPTPDSAAQQVDDLVQLEASLVSLKAHLAANRRDRTTLERLVRDFHYVTDRLDERRRNLGAFFKAAARAGDFDLAERALDAVDARLSAAGADPATLSYVVTSLGKVLTFGWEAIASKDSAQGRVFRKMLELKQRLAAAAPPPPSADERAHRGRISVSSDPPGAEVLLDGVPTGQVTPCTLRDVPFGEHTVKLVLEGQTLEADVVDVRERRTYERSFDLKSMRHCSGRVKLFGRSNNAGVTVKLLRSVDGQWQPYADVTTGDTGSFRFERLPAALMKAVVAIDGFNGAEMLLRLHDTTQNMRPRFDVTLYELAGIGGSATWSGGVDEGEVRLYRRVEGSYRFVAATPVRRVLASRASFGFTVP